MSEIEFVEIEQSVYLKQALCPSCKTGYLKDITTSYMDWQWRFQHQCQACDKVAIIDGSWPQRIYKDKV